MSAAESGRMGIASGGWVFDAGAGTTAGDNGFVARKELEAWAAEHDVKHALWVSAESLIPRLAAEDVQRYGLRYLLGRLAVRDVGSRDSVRRLIGVRSLEGPITEAAFQSLEEAALVVRVVSRRNARGPSGTAMCAGVATSVRLGRPIGRHDRVMVRHGRPTVRHGRPMGRHGKPMGRHGRAMVRRGRHETPTRIRRGRRPRARVTKRSRCCGRG